MARGRLVEGREDASHGDHLSLARALTPRPVDGSHVVNVVNQKKSMGEIPLSVSVAIGMEIVQIFGDRRIHYAPIGASALGIDVAVPEAYLHSRPTSNLYEVQVHRDDEPGATEALTENGWRPRDVTRYFSITFKDENGKRHKVKTLQDQALFARKVKGSALFVMIMSVPTEYYRVRDGLVEVQPFTEVQTPGQSIAHKMLRAAARDKRDVVQIALANDLRILLGESGAAVISEMTARSEEAEHRFVKGVEAVLKELDKLQAHGDPRLKKNMALLRALKRAG